MRMLESIATNARAGCFVPGGVVLCLGSLHSIHSRDLFWPRKGHPPSVWQPNPDSLAYNDIQKNVLLHSVFMTKTRVKNTLSISAGSCVASPSPEE